MSAASAVQFENLPRPQAPPVSTPPIGRKIREEGSACIRILARSMYPWLRPGDQVFIRRWDFARIGAGDVILFERENRLYVHRIIHRRTMKCGDVHSDFLVTKADGLDKQDPPVSAREFLGRATRIHRGRRHIDLESLGQSMLGRALARVSMLSGVIYRPLRFAKRVIIGEQPVRRVQAIGKVEGDELLEQQEQRKVS